MYVAYVLPTPQLFAKYLTSQKRERRSEILAFLVFTNDSEEDRIYDMRARNACGLKINKIELFFLCREVLIISIKK